MHGLSGNYTFKSEIRFPNLSEQLDSRDATNRLYLRENKAILEFKLIKPNKIILLINN